MADQLCFIQYRLSTYLNIDLTVETLTAGILDGLRKTGDPSKTMVEQEDDIFPVALGVFGSAFGLIKVKQVLHDSDYCKAYQIIYQLTTYVSFC